MTQSPHTPLSKEAQEKRDELAKEHYWPEDLTHINALNIGFDAGYEIGRAETKAMLDRAVEVIKIYAKDYGEFPPVEIPIGFDYMAMMRPNTFEAREFLKSMGGGE